MQKCRIVELLLPATYLYAQATLTEPTRLPGTLSGQFCLSQGDSGTSAFSTLLVAIEMTQKEGPLRERALQIQET